MCRIRLIEKLESRSAGATYIGVDIDKSSRKNLCIKVQTDTPLGNDLYAQALIHQSLHRDEGFPKAQQFGQVKDYSFLATQLLGPTLAELFAALGHNFSFKCICIMAIQMIKRLESLHEHDYVHRNLNPSSFLIGLGKKASTIYLTDLESCVMYRDRITDQHKSYQTSTTFHQVSRYK